MVNSQTSKEIIITNELVLQSAQENIALYDKNGEQHYDIISAFIKSIRGSDPNAAVYWLARMVDGGEDVKFIARRMIIAASEDIGNANPTALVIANNCFQAVSVIGFPEARIILSQCAIYLACSPKSNASYLAIGKAQQLIKESGNLAVPLHLRNAPTDLMKELNYGTDYQYTHNQKCNFSQQEFLPDELINTCIYETGNNPKEKQFWIKTLKELNQEPNDFKNAINIFNKYNIFNECKKRTEEFISKSIKCLEKFPDTIIRENLIGLANESIERSK